MSARTAGSKTASLARSAQSTQETTSMTNTFLEKLHPGYSQTIELDGAPIVEEKSRFQNIRIFNSKVQTINKRQIIIKFAKLPI
jgi:hypothetical protein